jgi:hypothetical protein
VTASWKLLAATHLQRVMRRDLVNDSCAVRILGLWREFAQAPRVASD